MILDALQLPDGARLAFDVCIVGAGAAGITLARALEGSGMSVGVLESGGLDNEPDTQDLYAGQMSGIDTWLPQAMRFRQLGGTTAAWAGWCKPLAPEDFEERAWIPLSGWPFGFDELEPYYALANQIVGIGDPIWDAHAVAAQERKPLLLADSTRIDTRLFQFSAPVRFGTRYRSDLELAEDVAVHLHANVFDIVLTDALGSVDHLVCRTLEGQGFTVQAGTFVLAMGGIETARLLLASNRQVDTGVANSSDAVGRYFMEHPGYRNAVGWVLNGEPDLSFYQVHRASATVDDLALSNVNVKGVLEPARDVLRTEGLPTFAVSVQSIGADNDAIEPVTPSMIEEMLKAEAAGHTFVGLTLHTEQPPDPESRITLRPDDLDALGMPRVDLHWRIGLQDRQTIARGVEILAAEIGAHRAGRLWIPPDMRTLEGRPGPGGHHMGTVRMSDDPALGVLDGDGRCHDVDNLYVVGSSMFPTGGNSNPTLTIVALAERLAAHLLEGP